MKLFYVCSASPLKLYDKKKEGTAGPKFSIQMAQALDEANGSELEFISTSLMSECEYLECSGEIWDGKKFQLIKSNRKPILSEIEQGIRFFLTMAKRKNEQPAIVIEGIYCSMSICCVLLKLLFGIPCFCVLIDKPSVFFIRPQTVFQQIIYLRFLIGRKMLKYYSGIITFSKEALKEWSLEAVPYCDLKIGCSDEQIEMAKNTTNVKVEKAKTVVFAGTMIYYNCTEELIEAFHLLGNEYELHLYGYGPLQTLAESKSREYSNVFYHGRFDSVDTFSILKKYEVLINPRKIDRQIENFTFPSKIVEYLLTKRTVMSTPFKTMPVPYNEFVFLMEDTTPEEIAKTIKEVFNCSVTEREEKSRKGYEYVVNNQTYRQNAEKIIGFISNLRMY